MRVLILSLAAIVVGFGYVAPGKADDDDYEEYLERIRERREEHWERRREQQERYYKRLRDQQERRAEFLQEQAEREEEWREEMRERYEDQWERQRNYNRRMEKLQRKYGNFYPGGAYYFPPVQPYSGNWYYGRPRLIPVPRNQVYFGGRRGGVILRFGR